MAVVADQSAEKELRSAVRKHEQRVAAADTSEQERDEAIRDALAAGIPWTRVMEITGLSRARLSQIRRRSRL